MGRRLLVAYLLPYAVTCAVMAADARHAGRQGRTWAREEWRLHLTALGPAPVLSAGAAPVAIAIGCGVLAPAATSSAWAGCSYWAFCVCRA